VAVAPVSALLGPEMMFFGRDFDLALGCTDLAMSRYFGALIKGITADMHHWKVQSPRTSRLLRLNLRSTAAFRMKGGCEKRCEKDFPAFP